MRPTSECVHGPVLLLQEGVERPPATRDFVGVRGGGGDGCRCGVVWGSAGGGGIWGSADRGGAGGDAGGNVSPIHATPRWVEVIRVTERIPASG